MANIRYKVYDLPVKGVGAFTPLASTNPIASSWGLVSAGGVTGSPGTTPVPTPGPTRVWCPPISAIAETQPSNVSPDYILPDKYIAYAANGIGHTLPNRIHNDIPVPALSWINSAVVSMYNRADRIGGRNAMAWPRAFQRWATSAQQARGSGA